MILKEYEILLCERRVTLILDSLLSTFLVSFLISQIEENPMRILSLFKATALVLLCWVLARGAVICSIFQFPQCFWEEFHLFCYRLKEVLTIPFILVLAFCYYTGLEEW